MPFNEVNVKPLITVIVPCYNQGKYLSNTLNSVFQQTYVNWECIIINDGSPDDTELIANEWCKKDSRFQYYYKENGGVSSARNLGLEKCNGEFIQFLDSDDLLHANKLEESIDLLNIDNSAVVMTDYMYFVAGKRIPPDSTVKLEYLNYLSYLKDFDAVFVTPIHAALINRQLLTNFRFDEQAKYAEDWLMWLHIFKQKPIASVLNKEYAIYHYHGENATSNPEKARNSAHEVRKNLYEKLETQEDKTIFFNAMIDSSFKQIQEILNSNTYKAGVKVRRLAEKFPFIYKLFNKIK